MVQYLKIRQIYSGTNDVMFRSLPHNVPIHCYNLDRMPVDMFYMACFSTNLRNICNNFSENIIEIWNITFYIYIHAEALILCVHVCHYYLLSRPSAMQKPNTNLCTLSFPTNVQERPNDPLYIDTKYNIRTYVTTVRGLTTP
jgi:hypothetical protein